MPLGYSIKLSLYIVGFYVYVIPLDSVPQLLYVLGFYYFFSLPFNLGVSTVFSCGSLIVSLAMCRTSKITKGIFIIFYRNFDLHHFLLLLYIYAFHLANNPIKYVFLALFHRWRKKSHNLTKAHDLHFGLLCCKAATPSSSPHCVPWSVRMGTEVPLCSLQMERRLTATVVACPCFQMACYITYFWLLGFSWFHIIAGHIINKTDSITKHITLLPFIHNMEIELVASILPLLGIYGSLKFTRKQTTSFGHPGTGQVYAEQTRTLFNAFETLLFQCRNHCSSVSPSLAPLLPFNPGKGVSPVLFLPPQCHCLM